MDAAAVVVDGADLAQQVLNGASSLDADDTSSSTATAAITKTSTPTGTEHSLLASIMSPQGGIMGTNFFKSVISAATAVFALTSAAAPSPSPSSSTLLPSTTAAACGPASFTFPPVFGAELVSLSAVPVHSYLPPATAFSQEAAGVLPASGISFCNVTVTYTYPGQSSSMSVYVWLPLAAPSGSNSSHTPWNGRFVGEGGSGLAAGLPDSPQMSLYLYQGFVVATTLGSGQDGNNPVASDWALIAPGVVNWPAIVDYSYRGIHLVSVIGKSVTTQYFSSRPTRSYWVGCSTGGRQGLMLAQRFPTDYDGILAGCPAMNAGPLGAAFYWPQLVMNRLGVYPPPCQFAAIEAAAVSACDALDGQADGVVTNFDDCGPAVFDPAALVGTTVDCSAFPAIGTGSGTQTITAEAVAVAVAAWNGPVHDDGERLYYDFPTGAPLTGSIALASTSCSSTDSTNCTGEPVPLAAAFLRTFASHDPDYDLTSMTIDQYREFVHDARHEFGSLLGNNNTDLSRFRRAGGKLLSWHGAYDPLVTSRGTRAYYAGAASRDPSGVSGHYRHFEFPGVGHCFGMPGSPFPLHAFEALQKWVEEDVAPDSLVGNVVGPDMVPGAAERKVCPFPSRAVWNGGDADDLASYSCEVPS